MRKLFTAPQRALIKKDLGELHRPALFHALLWIPLLLAVGLPILFIFVSRELPLGQMLEMKPFERILPAGRDSTGTPGVAFYAFSSLLCPLLFVLIPLLISSLLGAAAFSGEKERGTMETLLVSPLTAQDIFFAKAAGSMLLSGILSAVWFLLFFICMMIGAAATEAPFFFNWNWVILVFLLSPALIFLCVMWMAAVSLRVKTVQEAVQTSSYTIFPLLVLFAVQLMGVFQFSPLVLLLVTAAAAGVGLLLFVRMRKRYAAEDLLRIS